MCSSRFLWSAPPRALRSREQETTVFATAGMRPTHERRRAMVAGNPAPSGRLLSDPETIWSCQAVATHPGRLHPSVLAGIRANRTDCHAFPYLLSRYSGPWKQPAAGHAAPVLPLRGQHTLTAGDADACFPFNCGRESGREHQNAGMVPVKTANRQFNRWRLQLFRSASGRGCVKTLGVFNQSNNRPLRSSRIQFSRFREGAPYP